MSSVSRVLGAWTFGRTGIQVINGEPSNPRGETFVEPELTPPVHGNKVTEPLVSKLVSYNVGNPVSVAVGGCGRIEEYGGSSGAV
jgi:hypothetical protein